MARPDQDTVEAVLILTERVCRWPIGHPKEPGFRFCGAPCGHDKPYCDEHMKTGHTKAGYTARNP